MEEKKKGSIAIQQHYLPNKSYLKHFEDPKGRLHTYRFAENRADFYKTAKYFAVNAKRLAKEGYIYETPDLPTNTLEKALQEIEDDHRGVLERKLLSQKKLSQQDEEKVGLFIEALRSRVPAQRSHLNSFLDELDERGREIAAVHNAPEAAERFSKEMTEAKRSFFADSIISHILMNPLKIMDLCVLSIDSRYKESFFIAADNPVSTVDFADANTFYGLQPWSKTLEIVAPITSRFAVFSNNAGITGYKTLDAFYVDEINARSYRSAKDFLLAHQPLDEKFYKRLYRHFPQSLVLKFIDKPEGKADRELEKFKKSKETKDSEPR